MSTSFTLLQKPTIVPSLSQVQSFQFLESQFLNALFSKICFSSYQKSIIPQKVKIEPIYELSIDTDFEQSDSEADSDSNHFMSDLVYEAESYSN
jgi:hypothetical protein